MWRRGFVSDEGVWAHARRRAAGRHGKGRGDEDLYRQGPAPAVEGISEVYHFPGGCHRAPLTAAEPSTLLPHKVRTTAEPDASVWP